MAQLAGKGRAGELLPLVIISFSLSARRSYLAYTAVGSCEARNKFKGGLLRIV